MPKNADLNVLDTEAWWSAFLSSYEAAAVVLKKEDGEPVYDDVSTEHFNRNDVKRIVSVDVGDEGWSDTWRGVFELNDGRFAFIRGRHESDGNDMEMNAKVFVASTLWNLIRFALDRKDRKILGLRTADLEADVALDSSHRRMIVARQARNAYQAYVASGGDPHKLPILSWKDGKFEVTMVEDEVV